MQPMQPSAHIMPPVPPLPPPPADGAPPPPPGPAPPLAAVDAITAPPCPVFAAVAPCVVVGDSPSGALPDRSSTHAPTMANATMALAPVTRTTRVTMATTPSIYPLRVTDHRCPQQRGRKTVKPMTSSSSRSMSTSMPMSTYRSVGAIHQRRPARLRRRYMWMRSIPAARAAAATLPPWFASSCSR